MGTARILGGHVTDSECDGAHGYWSLRERASAIVGGGCALGSGRCERRGWELPLAASGVLDASVVAAGTLPFAATLTITERVLDGIATDPIVIDTTAAGSHTIEYDVSDSAGIRLRAGHGGYLITG
jgi:hypothetical protein